MMNGLKAIEVPQAVAVQTIPERGRFRVPTALLPPLILLAPACLSTPVPKQQPAVVGSWAGDLSTAVGDRCREYPAFAVDLITSAHYAPVYVEGLLSGGTGNGFHPIEASPWRSFSPLGGLGNIEEENQHELSEWLKARQAECLAAVRRHGIQDMSPLVRTLQASRDDVLAKCEALSRLNITCDQKHLGFDTDFDDNVEPAVKARIKEVTEALDTNAPISSPPKNLPRIDLRGFVLHFCHSVRDEKYPSPNRPRALLRVWSEMIVGEMPSIDAICARWPDAPAQSAKGDVR